MFSMRGPTETISLSVRKYDGFLKVLVTLPVAKWPGGEGLGLES